MPNIENNHHLNIDAKVFQKQINIATFFECLDPTLFSIYNHIFLSHQYEGVLKHINIATVLNHIRGDLLILLGMSILHIDFSYSITPRSLLY